MRRLWYLLLVGLVLGGTAAACTNGGAGDGTDEDTTETTATSSTTPAEPTTTTAASAREADVRVYFSRGEKVAVAGRRVMAPAVARGAMEALIAGPDSLVTDIGMTSEVPPATELLGITIGGGVARVDLSGEFASGGGSLSMQMRVAQVVFTLTQFPTVDSVTFLVDGEVATDGIGGEGIPAVGVDRTDSQNVTPFVLVESPLPAEVVTSPLEIRGIANTFEANVLFEVTDADGNVLDEGFTTASGGSGVWSEFLGTVEFAADGPGTVTAFEGSARDGSRINVYDVPVTLG